MNYCILSFLIFITLSSNAQSNVQFSYEHFEEEFLKYQPIQKSTISKKDFDYGSMIVKETQKVLKGNPTNFNRADYFNVLSAFLTFAESSENIKIAFEKFKEAEGSCEYIIHFEKTVQNNAKYDIIRTDYHKQLALCKSIAIPIKKKSILQPMLKKKGWT